MWVTVYNYKNKYKIKKDNAFSHSILVLCVQLIIIMIALKKKNHNTKIKVQIMQHCTVTNSWSFHCLLLRYILDLFLNHRRVSRNIPVKLVLYNPARRVRSSPALCSLIFNAFLCTSWWQHLPYPWSFRADVRKRIHTDSTRGRNGKRPEIRREKQHPFPADEVIHLIYSLSWNQIIKHKPGAEP